jgi:hypothetical protein
MRASVEPADTGIHVAGAAKKRRAVFSRKRCDLPARRDEDIAYERRTCCYYENAVYRPS